MEIMTLLESHNTYISYPAKVVIHNSEMSVFGGFIWAAVRLVNEDGSLSAPVMARRPVFEVAK
jgi:hypothetical protein